MRRRDIHMAAPLSKRSFDCRETASRHQPTGLCSSRKKNAGVGLPPTWGDTVVRQWARPKAVRRMDGLLLSGGHLAARMGAHHHSPAEE